MEVLLQGYYCLNQHKVDTVIQCLTDLDKWYYFRLHKEGLLYMHVLYLPCRVDKQCSMSPFTVIMYTCVFIFLTEDCVHYMYGLGTVYKYTCTVYMYVCLLILED